MTPLVRPAVPSPPLGLGQCNAWAGICIRMPLPGAFIKVETAPMPTGQQGTVPSSPMKPSYYQHARGSAFNPATWTSLSAFAAGPRRDPFSRQTHIMAIADAGRGGLKRGPAYMQNTFGAGVTVPPDWPYSWETDVSQHTKSHGLQPSRGASVMLSGAAGASHPNCGILGPSPQASPHFRILTNDATEEEKRLVLLTGERHRRHAELRYQKTDTLGQHSAPR